MRNEKGQVVVFFALIMPVLVILLALAVNYGCLVDTKIKLQVAIDRAVFAGTARLAYIMNEIAKENWAIYKAFIKVDENFGPNSQQSIQECVQRVKEKKNTDQTARYQNMDAMLESAYEEADAIARKVAQANFPGADYRTLYGTGRLFSVNGGVDDGNTTDDDNEKIVANIVCAGIEGLVFDPKEVKTQDNPDLLKYTYSNKNYVALVAALSASFNAPVGGSIFKPVQISAVAAGQPYGGSIKRFALLAKEPGWKGKSIEEVSEEAMKVSKDGNKALWFRPALVPAMLALMLGEAEGEMQNEFFIQ